MAGLVEMENRHQTPQDCRLAFENDPSLFEKTRTRIEAHIQETPTRRAAALEKETGSAVYCKLENQQLSGSFKLRGVASKVTSLSESERRGTLVAASTGNHGAAFAHLTAELGLKAKLFVPTSITAVKREAIEALGTDLEFVGNDCVETELFAKRFAEEHGFIFVGPYNDPEIVLGQGTVAVEIAQQMRDLTAVFVPVGGGGLISGIAVYLKQVSPGTRIIGCQPLNSPVMKRSIEAGRIVEMESLPTLADATAGGIEPGSITFDLCRDYVDEFVTLTEDEIEDAMRHMLITEQMPIEGGAALSVAAFMKTKGKYSKGNVALIVSGGKVDPAIIENLGGE